MRRRPILLYLVVPLHPDSDSGSASRARQLQIAFYSAPAQSGNATNQTHVLAHLLSSGPRYVCTMTIAPGGVRTLNFGGPGVRSLPSVQAARWDSHPGHMYLWGLA